MLGNYRGTYLQADIAPYRLHWAHESVNWKALNGWHSCTIKYDRVNRYYSAARRPKNISWLTIGRLNIEATTKVGTCLQ